MLKGKGRRNAEESTALGEMSAGLPRCENNSLLSCTSINYLLDLNKQQSCPPRDVIPNLSTKRRDSQIVNQEF